jgi:3-oxoacyl-[acyl-carrier protein] reductase
MEMLLENKNAVIYGAAGAIGGAVARAFAREGAHVFLAGRTLAKLDKVAKEISVAGGVAETAQVDALDEQAIEKHIGEVIKQAGAIDISFNAIGWEDVQGNSLDETSLEDFARPIAIATRTNFLTATSVGRHMARKGSGVILTITATPARLAIPNVGGFGVACAAIEGLCRQLACELGPQGVRVVCLRSAGSPDAPGLAEIGETLAEKAGVTREELEASFVEATLLRRLPMLAEVGNVAALMASDYASPMTGTVANMTCGTIVD